VKDGGGGGGGWFIEVCLDTEKIEESDGFGMKFLYDDLGL
jgi:hypothetical protein